MFSNARMYLLAQVTRGKKTESIVLIRKNNLVPLKGQDPITHSMRREPHESKSSIKLLFA